MEKIITIGNKEIGMKATANTPKRYRNAFNKDLITDMQKLYLHLDTKTGAFKGEANFEVIENLAYIMAKQYDDSIGTQEEWMDNFGITDIYFAMSQILSLWGESQQTLSTPSQKIKAD